MSGSPEEEGPRYVGYYVTDPTSPARKAAPFSNGVPSFGDLGPGSQARRRLSTDQTPQSTTGPENEAHVAIALPAGTR